MRLTVVIVSWNVRELLAECLRSLFDDLDRVVDETTVWVVDNASTDGTLEMVADKFPSVRLTGLDENRGFAAGNNVALQAMVGESAEVRPDVAWLLNPDTVVRPGATAALLSTLGSDPAVGVAGAKLLFPDGSLQQGAFRFPGLLQLAFELLPLPQRLYDSSLNGRYPRRLYEGERPFSIDHPLGASMMVRVKTVNDVGLMDEGYRMYCEEIDWCWRMRESGWNAVCVPTAEVVHHVGQSTLQAPVRSFVDLWTSRARLYAHHHGPTVWRLSQTMVRIGMRRRIRLVSPELAEACREVIRVWERIR